ncbi:MAG: hypothetical protein KDD66_11085 [Bdellovibrionales bacterium]|nr:hypothetical protein [Bdellovibrionales bacterium]
MQYGFSSGFGSGMRGASSPARSFVSHSYLYGSGGHGAMSGGGSFGWIAALFLVGMLASVLRMFLAAEAAKRHRRRHGDPLANAVVHFMVGMLITVICCWAFNEALRYANDTVTFFVLLLSVALYVVLIVERARCVD